MADKRLLEPEADCLHTEHAKHKRQTSIVHWKLPKRAGGLPQLHRQFDDGRQEELADLL